MKNYQTRWNEILEDVRKSGHASANAVAQKLGQYWETLSVAERQAFSNALHTSSHFRKHVDTDRQSRRLKRAILALRGVTEPMAPINVENQMYSLGGDPRVTLNALITKLVGYFSDMQKDTTWGGNVNCYAYAMNCRNPGGGIPIPGIYGGRPNYPYPHWDVAKLTEGAEADGATHIEGGNLLPPFAAPGGTYLVALFTVVGGFHWIKRDDQGRWSWKDGTMNPVQKTVQRKPVPSDIALRKMHCYVTDQMVAHLALGQYTPWCNPRMRFQALFSVPNGVHQVSGP